MNIALRAQAFGKKVTLYTATLVLAVSSLTALMPFVLSQQASAVSVDMYVATTGSDANDCATAATPCLTIQAAINKASPSDEIRVADGVYNEDIVFSKAVSLRASSTHGATIKGIAGGSLYTVSFNGNSSDSLIEGFVLDNVGNKPVIKIAGTVNRVYVFGNEINQELGASHSAYIGTGAVSNVIFASNTFYVGNNVRAIYGEKGTGSLSNISFINNTFVGATNMLLIGLEAINTSFVGNILSGVTTTNAKTLQLGDTVSAFSGNSAIPGNVVEVRNSSGLTRGAFSDVYEAVKYANAGDSIQLVEDITLNNGSLQLMKPGLALYGNNHTITANFPGVNGTVNAAVVYVGSDDVVISNVTVNGPSSPANTMHGIQAWKAQNVTLNNVTVQNNTKYGLLANMSTVAATNLVTSNNAWGGVNVQGPNANLTVLGSSSHSEPAGKSHIHIDDRADTTATVNDVNSQYVRWWSGAGYSYMLDASKPAAVISIDAINPSSFTVAASDDQRLSRIDVSIFTNNNTTRVAGGGAWLTTPTYNGDFSSTLTGLADGEYTARATVVDVLGKTTNSANVNFIVDKTGPTIVLPADSGIVAGTSLNLVGTVEDVLSGVDHYRYRILDSNKANTLGALGWSRNGGTGAVTNGLLSTVDLSGLADGTYHIRVWGFDLAGNRTGSIASPYITKFVIDTTAPEVSISGIADGDYVDGVVAITGNVIDANPMNTYFEISGPNGYTKNFSGINKAFTSHSINWNTAGLAEGDYTIMFEARDAAGNKTAVSATTVTVSIDRTAPAVAISSATPNRIEGTSEADSTVILTVNGVALAPITVSSTGTWFRNFAPALAAGNHTIVATAQDVAGNTSAPQSLALAVAGPVTPVTPATPVAPAPLLAQNNAPAVLGDQTTATPEAISPVSGDADNGEADTKGASDTVAQVAADNDGGSFWGVAWYWWLLIAAAALAFFWWLIAAIRRRKDEE